jgi:hypothetical protein
MYRFPAFLLLLLLLLALVAPAAAADKPTLKTDDAPPPKELAEPVRALLAAKGLTALDDKGKPLCTVWPRKALEAKAGADAAALKYASLDETTLIGAVRFPDTWGDYRKQKVKPGVYTLRLGFQPMDGDHMGTAPFNDFALLVPAALDTKPDLLDAEGLHQLSAKASGRKHPGVMLLFPNRKPADAPAVEPKPSDTWVLSFKLPTAAGGKTADLGFSLVVVGQTMAE